MNNGYIAVKEKLLLLCRQKKQASENLYYSSPKKCLFCKSVIPYEMRWRNKFCNHSCSAKFTNSARARTPNKCIVCGKDNKREHYYESHFCSGKCKGQSKYEKYISRWLGGEENGGYGESSEGVSIYVRKYLIDTRGEKCELCPWNEINKFTGRVPLTIHHIDGNPVNHKIDNLQILCPNCHSLTPSYGSLNIGNGRKSRQTKRKQKV